MRITNAMSSNNILLNLQKNMAALSKTQYQASTGNKIQFASDDPIIAGRALRLRASLTEVEQYKNNVAQASAWLDQSSFAMGQVNELLFSKENSIRSNLTLAATGTTTISDKQKYLGTIKELLKELTTQGNSTYNGRYVFSGYRTDEPAIISKDQPDATFDIYQKFSPSDAEKTTTYFKDPGVTGAMPKETGEYYRIKIPYTNGVTILSPSTIEPKSLNADPDCYQPTNGAPHFIAETGEIVMTEADYNSWKANPASFGNLTYQKQGLYKDEPNPKVYFDCKDVTDPSNHINYKMYDNGKDYHKMEYEIGVGNKMQVNTLAKDFITAGLISDLKEIVFLVENAKVSTVDDLKAVTPAMTDDEIKKQIEDETSFLNSFLGEKINQAIGKMDKHADVVSKEYSAVGAKGNRLELIDNRLGEERTNYTELKLKNESVDIDEVMIRYQTQLSVYSLSLQIGAGILQTSLGNFI